MADSFKENLRRLSEQAKRLPKPKNHATVWRWSTQGVRGVVLETVKIGGMTYASDEAVQRFMDELNKPKAKAPSPVKTRRSRGQQKASRKKADEILSRAGI